MKRIITAFSLCTLLGVLSFADSGDGKSTKGSSGSVTVYQVPWRCPAALQIGCGSHAKPILLRLERSPGVGEAWLNGRGTTVAVIWKVGTKRKELKGAEQILKEAEGTRLRGEEEAKALADFASRKGWYRGPAVDRLSEEEAEIIAARWVRRLRTKTTLTEEKAIGLREALADGLGKCLTGQTEMPVTEEKKLAELRRISGPFLDEEQIKMLAEAAACGMRARPDEE